MRCLKEDFIPGAIFHIYNHAIDDYNLFYDDEDYDFMLNIFEDNIDKIPGSIFAYCLMPNHYHFLIRQDSDVEIYRLFNYSFISYAHYFNSKYERKGPIFQSPLQHISVDNDQYLLQLCKYIHLNPVRSGLVEHPCNWVYSDYNEWISSSGSNKSPIIDPFKNILPENYSSFVDSYFNFLSFREYRKLFSGD
jgi:REP-associated tyrosine transposase